MSDQPISEIRSAYINGAKQSGLAVKYGLSNAFISKVVRNQVYKDAEYAEQLKNMPAPAPKKSKSGEPKQGKLPHGPWAGEAAVTNPLTGAESDEEVEDPTDDNPIEDGSNVPEATDEETEAMLNDFADRNII